MPLPSVIMFDWTGTLVDSLPWTYQAIRAAFLRFDLEPPAFEIYRTEILKSGVLGFLRDHGIPETTAWPPAPVMYETYLLKHLDDLALRDGAREMFVFCRDRGIRIAIVNCLMQAELLYSLEQLDIGHFVDHVQTSSYGRRGIASVLFHFGAKPTEAVYVGSVTKGLEVARGFAGIKIIALTGGFQPSEKILEENADCLITTLRDLPLKLEGNINGAG